jgi:hypothetical protein
MNKIISGKGNEYVEHEGKRCACFDRLLTFWVMSDFCLPLDFFIRLCTSHFRVWRSVIHPTRGFGLLVFHLVMDRKRGPFGVHFAWINLTTSFLAFSSITCRFLHSPLRYSLSLGKILAKQNISVKKADEIQVKVNILKAFEEGPIDGKARDTAEL